MDSSLPSLFTALLNTVIIYKYCLDSWGTYYKNPVYHMTAHNIPIQHTQEQLGLNPGPKQKGKEKAQGILGMSLPSQEAEGKLFP